MTLQQRIDDLNHLENYIKNTSAEWENIKAQASRMNPWFVPEFIELATKNIAEQFLEKDKLVQWAQQYSIPGENDDEKTVGLVMAGNIPLVGFHDMICIFISGHKQKIKTSSKDEILINFLVNKLVEFDPEVAGYISFSDQLKGCDAYIATGSNNTSRYFEYYFGKYPNIIRKNRTSVAVLNGNETTVELTRLADDIQVYFGLGCRNVTKIYVPENYNFEPLLEALKKYDHYTNYHKYMNNYDYQLALLMMGNKKYMTNGSVLLAENASVFSAISQVHYEYYNNQEVVFDQLKKNENIQCIVGEGYTPFGEAQSPALSDYADGVDTLEFLLSLSGAKIPAAITKTFPGNFV